MRSNNIPMQLTIPPMPKKPIKVDDEFVLHSSNGMDYKIVVININYFRPPESVYACDVWDGNGVYAGDVMFFDEDFFNQDCVERK